jgi:hypothetical protein
MTRGAPRLPPPDFHDRALPVIRTGGLFYRCALKSQPLLNWDARPGTRFGDPLRPILYLANGKPTAFWECFGDELIDQAQGERALSVHMLGQRHWTRFTVASLRVLDLTDPRTLRAMGADGATFLAGYAVTRQWATELWAHKANLDGVRYRSRLDSGHYCLAVFGRPELMRGGARKFRPVRESGLLQDVEFLMFLAGEDIALL